MTYIVILMGFQIISPINYDCIVLHCIVSSRDATKRGEVWHGPYDITKSLQSSYRVLFFSSELFRRVCVILSKEWRTNCSEKDV